MNEDRGSLNKPSSFFPFRPLYYEWAFCIRLLGDGFAKPYSSKWAGEKRTPINSLSIGEKRGTSLGKCFSTFASTPFLISNRKTYFPAVSLLLVTVILSPPPDPPHLLGDAEWGQHWLTIEICFQMLLCLRKVEWGMGLFISHHR